MLEQRDDVGERLVERRHVDIRPLGIARMQAVEQRVRGLVRNDVMRDCAEDDGAAHHRPAAVGGREIAEEQRDLLRIVVGVRFPQRMRIDSEPLYIAVVRHGGAPIFAERRRRPKRLPAERQLEALDRAHRHRIGHLLMELRA